MARVTVQAWERVVRYRDGQLAGVFEPGRYRYWPRRQRLVRVDLRPQVWPVSGQELLTADSLTVRVSVHAEVRVSEPARYVAASAHPQSLFHPAVQLAIRDAVGRRTLELASALSSTAARLGIAVEQVAVRDVMLPADLRRAAAEVVLARQRGLADLERARSEAATLRSLANTARLLAEHPELLRLRTLQAAESVGTTVVLTTS